MNIILAALSTGFADEYQRIVVCKEFTGGDQGFPPQPTDDVVTRFSHVKAARSLLGGAGASIISPSGTWHFFLARRYSASQYPARTMADRASGNRDNCGAGCHDYVLSRFNGVGAGPQPGGTGRLMSTVLI